MDQRLIALLEDIRKIYQNSRIYLFGSRARGDAKENSDFDLIIINEKFNETPFVDRAGEIWLKSDVIIPADLLCYTPEEFERISKTSIVLKDAMKHAVLL